MKTMRYTLGLLLLGGMLSSCGISRNVAGNTAPAQELKTLMTKAAKKGIMFGHHDDPMYGIKWEGDPDRSDVKSVCGEFPAVMSFDLGRLELGHTKNLDNISVERLRDETVKQYLRGGMVSFSWHADNPVTGKDAWDVSQKGVVKTLLPGGVNHDKMIAWLDRIADFLNSIRTPDGKKVPVLFRPWHEHTGSWFWWGKDLCSVEDYKSLWKMAINRLKEKGCSQLLYAYSPGADQPSAEDFFERYPGDDLIDVIGFDAYQMKDRSAYVRQMKQSLKYITEYARTHDKIAAITETGYETIPDAKWWTGTLLPLIEPYHIAYVLVWRNARERDNHYYAPYPGQVSAADFVQFYKHPKTLFLGDVKQLMKK